MNVGLNVLRVCVLPALCAALMGLANAVTVPDYSKFQSEILFDEID